MLIAILIVLGLSLLILGHEAGHFFAAKAFGLKVDEFGVGFPPRIFGVRRYRGTDVVPIAITFPSLFFTLLTASIVSAGILKYSLCILCASTSSVLIGANVP